jgi:hypothetical protein
VVLHCAPSTFGFAVLQTAQVGPHALSLLTQGPVLEEQQPVWQDVVSHTHEPETHLNCEPQAFPHVPQLKLSPSVPLGHTQLLPLQCSPPVHTLPHEPQLLLSPSVPLAHTQPLPLQVSPLVHWCPHVTQLLLSPSVPLAHAQPPLMHCSPLVHWWPQVPQLLLSPSVPLGHAQPPLMHCSPPGHTLPHDPQLLLSLSVPLAHAQPPPLHVSPLVHTWEHVPQLLLSVDVLTHAVPHCLVVGDAQLRAHELPLHVACPVPAVGPEQAAHVALPPQPFDAPGMAHPPGQEMAPGSHVQ